jgi:uncharacterized integral membrane protein (TIGR00697 family)
MNQVSENPVKNRKDPFSSLVVIAGLMIACYLTANIMAVKLIAIGSLTLFDAGTLTFPLAYMLGDVLAEVWGFKTAKKVIWLTFACNIFLVIFTTIGVILPYPEHASETAKAYSLLFSYVPRITLASLLAFLFGELLNAWLMVVIKKKTGQAKLWVRTIGSSVFGHLLDTSLFVLIAFLGTVPMQDIFSMIGVQYIAKLGVEAIAATPMAYGLIHILKKRCCLENG